MRSYFFECEVMRLFSVVLRVVIAVHKYDGRLFINGDQWEGHAVIETHEFDMISMFPPTVDASVPYLYPPCAGRLHSLE